MLINTALIKNKYRAPKNISMFLTASPYPAVHIGGIRAVAIATPGNAAVSFDLELATMPAVPPKKAIRTSRRVGFILDSISCVVFPSGVTRKYTALADRLKITAAEKCRRDLNNVSLSAMPKDKPMPRMGDISGDTSIAPIITAGESTSRPIDASTAEHRRNQ